MRSSSLAIVLAALSLGAPAVVQAQAAPIAAPQPGEGKEDARLKQLFHDSDEASLARNPISGIFRGDMRRADRIGDFFSDAYIAAERAASLPVPAHA